MPRTTRAALRSQASPEASEIAATVPLPATPPVTRRTPLGEISGNQEEFPAAVEDPEGTLKANKGPRKGKKGKASKKPKKNDQKPDSKKSEDVLPDDNGSETSSAVEDACQDLLKEQAQDISQVVMHDQTPHSPPSPAVMAATEQLLQEPIPHPQNFTMAAQSDRTSIDPTTPEVQGSVLPAEQELSHPEDPKQTSGETHDAVGDMGKQESQAPLQDECRSPAKMVIRPEDSIEALDEFEDEMEKVGDLIPTRNGSAHSPKESTRHKKTAATGKTNAGNRESTRSKVQKNVRKSTPGVNAKAVALMKKGAAIHPSALSNSEATKEDAKTRQVSDSSNASEKAPTAAKKRISSVHKAPFVPAKSTKPPTRSNFELPGEAVARKLKEAREERMKREEGEKAKKPAFKARPVRLSQAPVVKPTATSRARISIAKGEIPAASGTKDATPKPKVTSRPSAISAASADKRLSTLSVKKRSGPASAKPSARVTRGPSNGSSSTNAAAAKPVAQSDVRRSVVSADVAQLKAKGKEVFNRGRVEQDERDRMRKEKEEAAKKARAEAAERGRIASREWAEKQKAKKMAEKKVKSEGGEASVSTE
ncbi:MAG: hypothetical protein Q9225_001843 [Loekoesia sp. 1 TL-2023]